MYAHGNAFPNNIGNQGQQLDYISACIACWSLGRFEFALEVGLVVSHIGVDSSTFHVAFEHT